jgi:cytoskeletal protein CcmA (bactofilin family)
MKTLLPCKVLVGLVLVLLPTFAIAAQFAVGEQPSLAAGTIVSDDVYMAGGSVTSAATIRGDLIAGGGSVLVSGPVTGDVIVGGGNVTILGEVSDDVRAGGGTVIIQGVVRGDVVAGGGQISMTGPRVDGDIVIGGGSVRVDAAVGGDVHVAGGDVYVNAPVGGNVLINSGTVTLGGKAVIAGNLTYEAEQAATIETGAIVRGETNFTERAGSGDEGAAAALAAIASAALFAKLLMSIVGSLAIAYFFHRYSHELVATAVMQPVKEFVRGIVTLIVLPILSIILIATILGLPLGLFGLLAFGMLILFGSLIGPLFVGSLIHKWIWKPAGYVVNWKTVLIGCIAYVVFGLIPVVGWIATSFFTITALGAALRIKWEIVKEWR